MTRVYDYKKAKKSIYKKTDYKKSPKWKGNLRKIIVLEFILILSTLGITIYIFNKTPTLEFLLIGFLTGLAFFGVPILCVFLYFKNRCYGIQESLARNCERIILRNGQVSYEFTQPLKAEKWRRVAYVINEKDITSIDYDVNRNVVKINGPCQEITYHIQEIKKNGHYEVLTDSLTNFQFPMYFNKELFEYFTNINIDINTSPFIAK